jgi:hypothetical protein
LRLGLANAFGVNPEENRYSLCGWGLANAFGVNPEEKSFFPFGLV